MTKYIIIKEEIKQLMFFFIKNKKKFVTEFPVYFGQTDKNEPKISNKK